MPRRTAVRLTQSRVEAHRSTGKAAFLWDTEAPGLGLEAVPGRKSWVLSYRLGGKARRITIGRYPAVGLQEARGAARAHRATLDGGDDPALARRRVAASGTLAELHRGYIEGAHFRSRSADFRANFASTWRRYIEPALGHLAVAAIRRVHVRELVDALVQAGKPGMAAGVRTHLAVMLEHAVDLDLVQANPARGVRVPAGGRRTQWLRTKAELRAAWNLDTHPDTLRLVRFVLLTGCRRDEARLLTWEQVTDGYIEWSTTKSGNPHSLPVLPMMRAVMGRRGTGPVFGDQPRGTLDWRIRTATQGAWSLHVLRHTVESQLAELGVSEEHRDLVLNHQRRSVGARYRHGRQLDAKRAVLTLWHTLLGRHFNQPRSSSMVPVTTTPTRRR
jgi:integrase